MLLHATSHQLEQAAAFNHTELFSMEAAILGGTVRSSGGLVWTQSGEKGGSMIAFPDLSADDAGEHLDRMIADLLDRPPRGAGCWSLDPPRPHDLGVRLLARGFQPGWRPCWMGFDLDRISAAPSLPKGFTILRDNHTSLLETKDLPYTNAIVPPAGFSYDTDRWTRFVAVRHRKVIAQCVVFLTTGELGVAGIYQVGVVPKARRKGIGKAITAAACLYAREKGCRYAVLNATDDGRRMYEQMGFIHTGDGWTWWLITERLLAHPPTPGQVALAEAIGRGDLVALNAFGSCYTAADLATPLTNGMTLMQLAVHCKQPRSREWLSARGIRYIEEKK